MASMPEFLTFDDVVIVPGFSPVEPSEVRVDSRVTRNIRVSIPLLSSPMDTVTGERLATELARLGAVGVIHRNNSRSEQAEIVRRVKEADPHYYAGYRLLRVGQELRVRATREPVILVGDDGRPLAMTLPLGGGIDYYVLERAEYTSRLVSTRMVEPSLDEDGRLLVGGAVSPFDIERARLLEESGADFLVTDVAHLHNRNALSSLARLVDSVSIDVIAGNLGTREAVLDVVSRIERVSGLRMGISSGSICSTGEVAGASVPTLQAVMNARSALEELGLQGKIPIIADGGIRGPGDMVKAVIAGASALMGGRLFAGTEESLGLKVRIGGRVYKTYRGMASRGAIERRHASDRYSRPSKQLEEGVEGLVPYTGSAAKVLAEAFFGLQAGLGYAGASSIVEAWSRGRLARVSPAGRSEIRPHDIILG